MAPRIINVGGSSLESVTRQITTSLICDAQASLEDLVHTLIKETNQTDEHLAKFVPVLVSSTISEMAMCNLAMSLRASSKYPEPDLRAILDLNQRSAIKALSIKAPSKSTTRQDEFEAALKQADDFMDKFKK